FDSRRPRFARLGFERRITWITDVESDRLFETRLLDSLAVIESQPSFTPEASSLEQCQRSARSRHNAGTEAAVRFNSAAKAQRHPRMRRIAEIQKAALVVPARVICLDC